MWLHRLHSSEVRTCERRPFDQSRVHADEREGTTLASKTDPVHCDSEHIRLAAKKLFSQDGLRRMRDVEDSAAPLAPYFKPLDEL